MYKINLSKIFFFLLSCYIFLACFGSISFAYIYKHTDTHFFLIAGGLKDLIVFLMCFFFIFSLSIYFSLNCITIQKQYFLLLKYAIILIVLFCFNLFRSSADILIRLFILRRYLLPLVMILLFSFVEIKQNKLENFLKPVIYIVCIFGLIEYFLPFDFWDSFIALPRYWLDSGDKFAISTVKTSGRFVSFDLVFLLEHPVRRMCSTFAEPTNFASFLISSFIIFNKNKFLRFLIFLCCCMIVSKAALVILVFVLPFIFIYRKFGGHNYRLLFFAFFLSAFLISFLLQKIGLTTGAFSHIFGFYNGVVSILQGNLFGYGLGSVGNYANERIFGSLSFSESGIGGMIGQCGIAGIVYIFFFYEIIKVFEKNYKNNIQFIILTFSWMIMCFFSESAFGASGNILFFVFIGIGINKSLYKDRVLEKNRLS